MKLETRNLEPFLSRIQSLKQFIEEDPHDPFNHYALALEMIKTAPDEAYAIFNTLITSHPAYLPTYYPFAQMLIDRKEFKRAEEVFQSGIEMARNQRDAKTLRELQAAYGDWLG